MNDGKYDLRLCIVRTARISCRSCNRGGYDCSRSGLTAHVWHAGDSLRAQCAAAGPDHALPGYGPVCHWNSPRHARESCQASRPRKPMIIVPAKPNRQSIKPPPLSRLVLPIYDRRRELFRFTTSSGRNLMLRRFARRLGSKSRVKPTCARYRGGWLVRSCSSCLAGACDG